LRVIHGAKRPLKMVVTIGTRDYLELGFNQELKLVNFKLKKNQNWNCSLKTKPSPIFEI